MHFHVLCMVSFWKMKGEIYMAEKERTIKGGY